MEQQEIERRIKVSDWVRPFNQLVSLALCSIQFELLLDKTGEWRRFNWCSSAVVRDDEAKKMTDEQLWRMKEAKISNAKYTLVRKFFDIREQKECFFEKSDETVWAEEGDSEDRFEAARFDSEWAKSKNDANRAIAYKEEDAGFFVKVNDIRLVN